MEFEIISRDKENKDIETHVSWVNAREKKNDDVEDHWS